MAGMQPPRNIFVVGAQSTGKTTLVNALEEALTLPNHTDSRPTSPRKPKFIREVARTVLSNHHFSRDDMASPARALQLQKLILEAQLKAELAASGKSSDWYISDRSGLDPIAYAKAFVGDAGAEELLSSPAWMELEQRMKAGLVILCEAGGQWLVDDGTRLMPSNDEDWMRVDQTFRRLLSTLDIKYCVVSKSVCLLSERVSIVLDALKWTCSGGSDQSS